MTAQTGDFSSRVAVDLRQNRIARLLAEKSTLGVRILDLTESNPTNAGFSYDERGILGALADPGALTYRPAAKGLPETRAAVAGYYRSRGIPIDANHLVLTASTSEAYSFLFKLLTDPGDEVLAPQPSYPLFDFLSRMELAELRRYSLPPDGGWRLDVAAIAGAVRERTRAVIVVNPNNPTGSYLKREELERLLDLCTERRLALIVDEVFHDFALREDPNRASAPAGTDRSLSFTLNGFSKLAGLPQVKLGWILVSGPAELRDGALERLELIADTYLSVATPVQHAAARLFETRHGFQTAALKRIRDNLARLHDAIRDNGCSVLDVEGGWYAIVQLPAMSDEEELVLHLLAEDNVLVQPGFFYDFPAGAHVVLSLLTLPDTFEEGLRRLVNRLGEKPWE